MFGLRSWENRAGDLRCLSIFAIVVNGGFCYSECDSRRCSVRFVVLPCHACGFFASFCFVTDLILCGLFRVMVGGSSAARAVGAFLPLGLTFSC